MTHPLSARACCQRKEARTVVGCALSRCTFVVHGTLTLAVPQGSLPRVLRVSHRTRCSRPLSIPSNPSAVKSIEDLSTIFKELAVLVIDQGTILDRIDFNMEQVRRNWFQLSKRKRNQLMRSSVGAGLKKRI